ncbi:MAG: Holliday junction resolvase RuvX [Kofleriaceae bacterium]
MRALGLDVGSKAIGVALSDEIGMAAHPLTVLVRRGIATDTKAVADLVQQHSITDIVIGMPYELSGRVGHRARRVKLLADALSAAIGGATVHEQDERFTTAQAERVLIEADLSRARRREVIDQQAAVLILQGWLDANRATK